LQGSLNYCKFFAKLWVKRCIDKTAIFDVVQEKLTAKGPEGRSNLLVKVCKVLANTYCDSGKERKDNLEYKRLIINGYPHDLHIPVFSYGARGGAVC
jgi:hypothetical protein